MASHIKRGESLFIPFRNGESISDSQLKPRMYKTMKAFEKSYPGHYLGTSGVELVEYAEVVHGRWVVVDDGVLIGKGTHFECSKCGQWESWGRLSKFCPNCGAKMDDDGNA